MKKIYSILLLAALCFGNMQADELGPLYDGTNQYGSNIPLEGNSADYYQRVQVIYPKADLAAMAGKSITKMTFYVSSKASKVWGSHAVIRLVETSADSFTSTSFLEEGNDAVKGQWTVVYDGTGLDATGSTMVVAFSTPFEYSGDNNLLFELQLPEKTGSYAAAKFSAKGGYDYSYSIYKVSSYGSFSDLTTGTRRPVRPKTLFTYEETAVSSCAAVGVPVASDITATSAKLAWEKAGEVEDYQFECVRKGVAPSWTAAAQKVLTVTLDTLKTDTEYDFYVRAYCGDGEDGQGKAAKVSFQTERTCFVPTLLGVVEAEITSTTAKVTWHASGKGETTYQYTYALYGQDPDWTNAPKTTEKEVTLSGLTPKTAYQVWVRSYCADDDQSEAITESFATACGAEALPFEEDFSSDTECWKVKTNSYSTGVESGWFKFAWQTAPPYQYLITPELQASANKVIVEFDYKAHSTTYPETFKVGYSTTTNDETSAFTWSDELTMDKTTVETYKDTLPAGVKYIAIECTSNNQYYLYIDNFKVSELPTCANPTELKVDEITDNSAKATWASEASKFALELKEGEGEWTAVNADITTPSYDLTNLKEHTTYAVRVKAICDTDFESEWIESEAFTTECSVKEYGYAEIFAAELEACWDNSEYHGNQWSPATDDEQNYFLRYKSSDNAYGFGELVTPAIAIPSESEPVVLFEWMNTGVTGVTLKIWNGETEAVLDADLDTELNKVTGDADSRNWKVMKANLTAYKGKTVAFKFHADGNTKNKYVFLDNFTVAQKPYSLLIPDNVEAEATEDGAIVTWTPAWDEPAWDLSYSVKDADSWTLVENLAATTYTITGLAEGEYEVRVRAAFEAAQSLWSEAAIFEVVKPTDPTAISNTAVKATAIKRIVNGQLIIERNGEQYNAQGVSVK